jgi:hypothetical protein
MLDKAREQYKQPKLWLTCEEFLWSEYHRISRNLRYDRWTSVLLGAGVASVGLYLAPFLSAGLRIVCLSVTGAAVLAIQLYNYRKITQCKRSPEPLMTRPEEPLEK